MEESKQQIISENSSKPESSEIDESLIPYYDKIGKAIDNKFISINQALETTKESIKESVRTSLKEGSIKLRELNQQRTEMDKDEANKIKSSKEQVANLRASINNIIEYCDALERFESNFNDLSFKDLLAVKKDEFSINNKIFKQFKLKNNSKNNVLWATVQRKQNFTLSDDQKTLSVTYEGCYNYFTSETEFTDGIHEIKIEIDADANINEGYHYIGVTNEKIVFTTTSCVLNAGLFAFYSNGTVKLDGVTNGVGRTFPKGTKTEITIILDCDNKTMSIIKEDSESEAFKINGETFKLFLNGCTSGKATYTIL